MYDVNLQLKDAGLVAASAAGQVDSTDKIINLGPGLVEGEMVVDVTAIEIASNDEFYQIALQGSSESDFADAFEELAILELGAKEVLGGDQDSTIGRYRVPFRTERNGTIYPYVRVYSTCSGSIATGINFSAWLTDEPGD